MEFFKKLEEAVKSTNASEQDKEIIKQINLKELEIISIEKEIETLLSQKESLKDYSCEVLSAINNLETNISIEKEEFEKKKLEGKSNLFDFLIKTQDAQSKTLDTLQDLSKEASTNVADTILTQTENNKGKGESGENKKTDLESKETENHNEEPKKNDEEKKDSGIVAGLLNMSAMTIAALAQSAPKDSNSVDKIPNFFQFLRDTIDTAVENMREKFEDILKKTKEIFNKADGYVNNIFDKTKEFLKGERDYFLGFIDNAKDFLKEVKESFSGLFDKVKDYLGGLLGKAHEVGQNVLNSIETGFKKIESFFENFNDKFKGEELKNEKILDDNLEVLKKLFEKMYKISEDYKNEILDCMNPLKDIVLDSFESLKSSLVTEFDKMLENLSDKINKLEINGVTQSSDKKGNSDENNLSNTVFNKSTEQKSSNVKVNYITNNSMEEICKTLNLDPKNESDLKLIKALNDYKNKTLFAKSEENEGKGINITEINEGSGQDSTNLFDTQSNSLVLNGEKSGDFKIIDIDYVRNNDLSSIYEFLNLDPKSESDSKLMQALSNFKSYKDSTIGDPFEALEKSNKNYNALAYKMGEKDIMFAQIKDSSTDLQLLNYMDIFKEAEINEKLKNKMLEPFFSKKNFSKFKVINSYNDYRASDKMENMSKEEKIIDIIKKDLDSLLKKEPSNTTVIKPVEKELIVETKIEKIFVDDRLQSNYNLRN